MLLSFPRRLGPYELESAIGAGGMGEVYRATDTRLHRIVAIKVLPAEVVANPARRQRFEREARTISSLTHPHICTLYDVGEQDGSPYLVMEYLDGETLAARLQRGAIPAKEAIRIGADISAALEHAHHQRVVHRDLKPGNVMLTRSGAKLLDFGLARLADDEAAAHSGSLGSRSETLTEEGTILGTVQYMAPEQLEARDVDGRTDIFAFGSVMYEMLTGRPAFTGATKASVIAAILERDPDPLSVPRDASDVAADPAAISPLLESVVMRCLAKLPADRWQTAADLRAALRWAGDGDTRAASARVSARPRMRARAWAAASVIGLTAITIVWIDRRLGHADSPGPPVVYTVNPPPHETFSEVASSFAVSPDGAYLAFIATDADGNFAIWLRPRDNPKLEPLRGTEGGVQPFWSADSRFLTFVRGGLQKVDIATKFVQTLTTLPGGRSGSWNRDGVVLFAGRCPSFASSPGYVVCRVPSSGGDPQPATRLDPTRAEGGHGSPEFLPDGRHFLYAALSSKPEFDRMIYVASLDDPTPVPITSADSNAVYSPPGYLVFMRGTALIAQPFDATALRLEGEPTVVADPVQLLGKGAFSLSMNGVLAYRAPEDTELAWFAPDGRRLGPYAPAGHYRNPVLSPDGTRIAVERGSRDVTTMDVWLLDRSGVPTSFSRDHARMPVWSPDGREIALRTGEGIVARALDSGTERLVVPGISQFGHPSAWVADARGASIIYEERSPTTHADLFIVPAAGGPSHALVQTPFDDTDPEVSPDGHWLAYVSDESGRSEVYVRRFPPGDERWRVSSAGGVEPHWSREVLLYLAVVDRALMSVPYRSGATFTPGEPVRLFQTRMSPKRVAAYTRNQYLVAADGRILINQPPEDAPPPEIRMIVNWTSMLKTPH
jgi:Tol biopolymer transport system component